MGTLDYCWQFDQGPVLQKGIYFNGMYIYSHWKILHSLCILSWKIQVKLFIPQVQFSTFLATDFSDP